MTGKGMAAVEARGLFKSFGNGMVLSDVSFRVERGTCFGLLGPNGAGKTTTLKIIYGFLKPSRGRAVVEGLDVARKPKEVKRRLGIVPQENTLDPDLDARQNLAFHARYAGIQADEARKRIERLGATMGIEGHLSSPVGELSSGLRRRLVLARALLGDPAVVILDEPTRGLDRGSRAAFTALLQRMKDGGTSFLLATHDLEEARDFCDDAAIMEGGRILEIGPGRELALRAASRHAVTSGNWGSP